MSTPELEDILGALEEEAAAGDYRDVEEPSGDTDYLQDYYRGTEEGSPDYVYNLNEELQPEGKEHEASQSGYVRICLSPFPSLMTSFVNDPLQTITSCPRICRFSSVSRRTSPTVPLSPAGCPPTLAPLAAARPRQTRQR